MQEAWPPQGEFVYYGITKIIKDGKSNNRSRNPKATSSIKYY